MKLRNIFKRLAKKKSVVESDNSYCYSQIVWNTNDNLIILLSFSKDYFDQIIEIQDAVNHVGQGLSSKVVFSSYDEEVDITDENGKPAKDLIIHNKYYILIGGSPSAWEELYMNIHNLGNDALSRITDEITNNCNADNFKNLVEDGILFNFAKEDKFNYNIPKQSKNGSAYTDPEVLMKALPIGFTGRDVIKFILIFSPNRASSYNGSLAMLNVRHMPNSLFKSHDLYPLFSALFNEPTVEKINMYLEPLYKQPDDDTIPGDISDEKLDELFREYYDRFSAIADDSIQYEDIDEVLSDDEVDMNEESETE